MIQPTLSAYADFPYLLDGLLNGEVRLALVDLLYVIPNSHMVEQMGIQQALRISHPTMHGILLSDYAFNGSAVACFQRELDRRRFMAYEAFNLNNKLGVSV